jgi:hypothetical protein
MRTTFLILLLASTCLPASAQQEAILKPIHTLFDAMKTGDTAVIRKVFHPKAALFTVVKQPQTGQPALRTESLSDFLKAVGKPRTYVYNELTWDEKVSVDGDFAQVWADYAFYLNNTFHHCGVDAFQLIKNEKGEWLIFVLSDTRRTSDCKVPAEVEAKLKK